MKNLLFITALLFFSANCCFAQFDWEMNRNESKSYNEKMTDFYKKIKDNGIKTTKTFVTDKHGKTRLMDVNEYNKNGKVKSHTSYDNKGRLEYKTHVNTGEDGAEYWVSEYYSRGRLAEKSSYSYDKNNRFTNYENYNRHGKLLSKTEHDFDKDGNNISSKFYKKGGKLRSRIETDYYPNGSKKEKRRYNAKNEVKEVYSYECTEMPKTIRELKKDTNRVCIKYEYDANGNRIKIHEIYNRRGGIYIFRFTYDAHDNIIKLESSDTKKKKFYTSYEVVYDEQNKPISCKIYMHSSQKIRTFKTYTYDKQGLLTYTSTVNKRNPETIQYQYERY